MPVAQPWLIANQTVILNSTLIQIVHIHPDNFHAVRSDLDHEDLVIDHFPIELAKKIFDYSVFESPQLQPAATSRRKRARSQSPLIRAESEPLSDTIVLAPPPKLGKTNTSLRGGDVALQITPKKQKVSQPELEDETIHTARTTTPGGNELSPLKPQSSIQSPRSPLALLKNTNSIPTGIFSPPRAPSTRGRGRGRGRGGAAGALHKQTTYQPRKTLPLVYFDRNPRSVDGSIPKMTVVLRHNLELRALQDFFKWCKRSVQDLRPMPLEGFLFNFHDWERVAELKEVALTIGLTHLNVLCDATTATWTAQLMGDRSRRVSVESLLS